MNEVDYISSKEISEIFNILSHPMRVSIVTTLGDKEMNYTSLQQALDNPSTGTLNFHLQKLGPLITKDGDRYKLSKLGMKSIGLIEQYIIEKKKSSPTEVVTQNIDYWQIFLDLESFHGLAVLLLGSLIIGILISISEKLGGNQYVSNILLLIGFLPLLRWAWQKVYLSSTPRGTLAYLFSVYLVSYCSLILFLAYSLVHDIGVISAYLYLVENSTTHVNQVSWVSSQDLSNLADIARSNIDLSTYFLIFALAPLLSLVWSYFTFNELPHMNSSFGTAEEISVAEVKSISTKQLGMSGIVLVSFETIFWLVVYLIYNTLNTDYQLLFYLTRVQIPFLIVLILLRGAILYSLNKFGIDIRGISSSNAIALITLVFLAIDLAFFFNLYGLVASNFDTQIFYINNDGSSVYSDPGINLSLLVVLIVLLNISFGFFMYSYDSYMRRKNPSFSHPVRSSILLLLLSLYLIQLNSIFYYSVQNVELNSTIFILGGLILVIIGQLSTIPSNPKKIKILRIALSLFFAMIIFGISMPDLSNFVGFVIVYILNVFILYFFSSIFAVPKSI